MARVQSGRARRSFHPGESRIWSEPSSRSPMPVESGVSVRAGRWACPGGRDVPEVGGVLLPAGEDGPAVGAEGDAPDLVFVAKRRADRLAGGLIPELRGPVELPVTRVRPSRPMARARSEPSRRKDDVIARPVLTSQIRTIRSHPPVMMVRPSGLKAATETGPSCCSGWTRNCPEGGIPEAGLHVVVTGQQGPAIGAERHGHHLAAVRGEGGRPGPPARRPRARPSCHRCP